MNLADLRQLTEELITKDNELQKNKNLLQTFFNMTLDLLCIASTDGYFIKLNPAWSKTLGYSEDELLATSYYDLIHPDDIERTKKTIGKLVEGEPVAYFRNRYRKKDGTYITLCWTSAPALEDGTLCAVARNHTEISKKYAG